MSTDDPKEASLPNTADPTASSSTPTPAPQTHPTQPQNSQIGGGNQSSVANGLGTVTVPSKTSSNQKKEFLKTSDKLIQSLRALRDTTRKLAREAENNAMSESFIDVWENSNNPNSRRIIIDDEYVTEAQGEKPLKVTSISQLSKAERTAIESDPRKFAESLLETTTKESNSTMATEQEKTAQVGPNNVAEPVRQEIITEKQLRDTPPLLHPRQNSTYETTIQDQLGNSANEMSDTTTDSPQTRKGTYEVITEGQFASISGNEIVRWNDVPEVVTEKQWTDASKAIRANLPR